MTPDTLAATGRALYGERWRTALAADLGVTDRTIARWMAGSQPIPDWLEAECRTLLERRRDQIDKLLAAELPI